MLVVFGVCVCYLQSSNILFLGALTFYVVMATPFAKFIGVEQSGLK